MVDLSTNYLGLTLKNPLVAAASPISKRIDKVIELEKAGAAAVVMYSLFEEQVSYEIGQLSHYLTSRQANYNEAISYYPHLGYYNLHPDEYIEHLYQLKQSLNIPVIGSINGISAGGWVEYAHHMEQAGADALEININYLSTQPNISGVELEEAYLGLVREVRARLRIPFALKLNPFFTSLPNMASRAVTAGVSGLVLFNRFYQPDLEVEKLRVRSNLDLSTSRDLRLPLRWVAILYGQIKTDFAISGGIHTAQDVLKAVLGGASVTMLASELLQNGIGRVAEIEQELVGWMIEHRYQSLCELKGLLSQQAVAEPAAFERASYLKILNSLACC